MATGTENRRRDHLIVDLEMTPSEINASVNSFVDHQVTIEYITLL